MTPQGQAFDEEEYESYVEQGMVDAQGNVMKTIEKDAEATSSASKAASSGSKESGSSVSSEDDSDSETDTSSDTGTSSDSKSTSDGTETTSSDTETTSSDSETSTTESSSSEESSTVTPGVNTIQNGDDEFSVGTNDMEDVDASTKTELDDLKDELENGGTPEGFENVGTSFDETTMTYDSFDEGDYYCFTGEGEWMHITRELLGQYIPHYKNGAAWGNLRHFEVLFMDACEGVYFRHK
jgi:hypothetical protein